MSITCLHVIRLYVCDMAHLDVWHSIIHMSDMTWHVWMSITYLHVIRLYVCDMAHLDVWHSIIHMSDMTWHIWMSITYLHVIRLYMCDMAQLEWWHAHLIRPWYPFTCVTWLNQVWHGSFVCVPHQSVTWLIHVNVQNSKTNISDQTTSIPKSRRTVSQEPQLQINWGENKVNTWRESGRASSVPKSRITVGATHEIKGV